MSSSKLDYSDLDARVKECFLRFREEMGVSMADALSTFTGRLVEAEGRQDAYEVDRLEMRQEIKASSQQLKQLVEKLDKIDRFVGTIISDVPRSMVSRVEDDDAIDLSKITLVAGGVFRVRIASPDDVE